MTPAAPTLVFGVGNPSRGDDALGPLVIERLATIFAAAIERGELELLTDFQLQIEHAEDLRNRRRVIFVDASVRATAPFTYERVSPRATPSAFSHAMSPEAVLATYCAVFGSPPETWVLGIRGERWELGEPLSDEARQRLEQAIAHLRATLGESQLGRRITIEGVVQGVGFRPWVLRTARELGLGGRVWNTDRGVTIEAFGGAAALDVLVGQLASAPPAAARLDSVACVEIPASSVSSFTIAASVAADETRLSLPPDMATCASCLRETTDETDRHLHYALTSCAECGPRFSIARALPYDRATTTMAAFSPCADCRREYDDPADRRFHAQTVACPSCGPRIWLADPHGARIDLADPLAQAATRLMRGEILGVQGLGAFHLVCDATSSRAVAELRRRKRRDQQPFAVLVSTTAAAEALARFDDEARAALQRPARPIVLVPSIERALPAEVNGPSRRTGVMLPYSALHQRLAALVARPLVVTSGNPSGGPAIIEHDEALTVLGPLVEAFLLHDRPIVRRVEDSVVTGARVLRRARGLAPLEVRLPLASPEPVLAVGGHQKSSVCLVVGDRAYVGPHLGDLGTLEAERAFARDVESFERLLGVHAQVLAHDLHPEYGSTRYAQHRAATRRIGIQHHVAHVLAALAEHRVDAPVLGVVFDGTGLGPDGSAWGAELLVVDGAQWTRAGTFRPLALAGGERAIREPWRLALAALVDAFGEAEALALAPRFAALAEQPEASLRTVTKMIGTGTAVTLAHGMGRWFDAIGALALGVGRAAYDGHVAMLLEDVADAQGTSYPISGSEPLAANAASIEIDLRPLVRAVVGELLAGISVGHVAARFHRSIIEATAAAARDIGRRTGIDRVVLSGGCFQNRILDGGLAAALAPAQVIRPRAVPPNDGGIALGQAWAAVLTLQRDSESL